MAIIVEDGTGIGTANAYVSGAACAAYAADRGLQFTANASGDAAIIRASAWIDGEYRTRYPGVRQKYRLQGLEWPRIGASDRDGYYIATSTVPIEVLNATCEAAVREQSDPGSLSPDLERGGVVQSLTAGSVGIVYGAGAVPNTIFQVIDNIMAPVVGGSSGMFGKVSRG